MTSFIIETRKLSKIFNKGQPNEVRALQDINVGIAPNQCTLIKGPSGSGKSTLLAVLAGLARPTSGDYFCLGNHVSRWSEKFLTTFRRRHIGIVFQNFNLIQGLTVEQNISLPLLPLNLSAAVIQKQVAAVSERVQLSHRLTFKVDTLSGGEMQRVAIARALINDPEILIADEPTAHLDTSLSGDILSLFALLKTAGKTLLITTHDPLVESHAMVDTILCMRDGHLGEDHVC